MSEHVDPHGSQKKIRNRIAVLLAGMTSVLAVASCNVSLGAEPAVRFIESDTSSENRILGFAGDSLVIIHQTGTIKDWYQSEGDSYSRNQRSHSLFLAYNYLRSSYSEGIPAPSFFNYKIFGENTYYHDGANAYSLDFRSNTANKLPTDPFFGATNLSGDGSFAYLCEEHSMLLVVPGTKVKMDSVPYEKGTCNWLSIASNGASKFLITRDWGSIQYAKILSNGTVSRFMDSGDTATLRTFVHNIGEIPFRLRGDRVEVPRFLDVDGTFTKAFNKAKRLDILEGVEWHPSLDRFIRNNAIFDAQSGNLIYAANGGNPSLW
ncbi:MAG: hypothetical protein IPK50_16335 [Fibrobacterota bacterium]|nr:MAG: hypothetical protein IPK50_16335 [Fibrobacterota bacterium]